MCGIVFKAPDLSQLDLALNFLSTLALGFVYNLLKTPFKKKHIVMCLIEVFVRMK